MLKCWLKKIMKLTKVYCVYCVVKMISVEELDLHKSWISSRLMTTKGNLEKCLLGESKN